MPSLPKSFIVGWVAHPSWNSTKSQTPSTAISGFNRRTRLHSWNGVSRRPAGFIYFINENKWTFCSFACLKKVDPHLEGNYLFIRFVATTGDAMGMNMVSQWKVVKNIQKLQVTKGTGRALALIKREFPQARLLSISGNFCVDKKPSALNWIEGRGKSVVVGAYIPAVVVERVLKTSVVTIQ